MIDDATQDRVVGVWVRDEERHRSVTVEVEDPGVARVGGDLDAANCREPSCVR
jgi:hypothetical protein